MKVNKKHKEAIHLFREGKELAKIGDILGLSLSNVKYIIYAKQKIVKEIEPKPKISEEDIARIVHLYRWGYTPNEISEEIDIKPSEIANIIYINNAERIPNINDHRFMEGRIKPETNRNSDRF